MSEFTREVRFVKGYDHRDDPNDRRGAHGMEIHFILRGPAGAITARVGTGWMVSPLRGPYRPNAGPQSRRHGDVGVDATVTDIYPTGQSISSHSPEPRQDWWLGPDKCDILGGSCWGDTGYLVADDFLLRLVRDGEDAAWGFLGECYAEWLTGVTA